MDSKKLEALREAIPCKWKPQVVNDKKATFVAYLDARQVQNHLDKCLGPENWQNAYTSIDGRLFCGIAVKIGEEWVWKFDTGIESNMEKEKGEVSDSFKRAAVNWGVGRFLYDLGVVVTNTMTNNKGKNVPCYNENGEDKILWPNHYTRFCESKLRGKNGNN